MNKGPGEQEVLVRILDSSEAVLFDFDGPVCDLFHGRSTAPIADLIKDEARAVWGARTSDQSRASHFPSNWMLHKGVGE